MNRDIIRRLCMAVTMITTLPVLLQGCNTTAERKHITLRAGLPVSELIASYGKPYEITQGNPYHFYSWRLREARLAESGFRNAPRPTVNSAGVVTYSGSAAPRIVTIRCELSVRVNQNHRVHDWQANGKGCRQILYYQI